MKLYKWKSGTFADWSMGSIIVMAPSLKAARKKAVEHYKSQGNGYHAVGVGRDIAGEPEVIESGVTHEYGSA